MRQEVIVAQEMQLWEEGIVNPTEEAKDQLRVEGQVQRTQE